VALAAVTVCTALAPSAPALAQPFGDAAAPRFTQLQAEIEDVAAVSPESMWAVGYSLVRDDVFLGHWNGSTWKPVRHPTSRTDAAFLGVSASSGDDVWAVGSHYVGPKGGKDSWTYIQHYDGTKWTRSRGANPSVNTDVLSAVSARTPTDAWAVGFQSPSADYPGAPLAEHWNGTKWRAVKTPAIPSGCFGGLTGVTAISADDAWAVGAVSCNAYTHTLAEHWDGTTWRIVASPNPGGDDYNIFNSVTAMGANAVWAVGAWSDSSQSTHPLAARWTGSSWKVVKVPTGTGKNCQNPGASLIGVATDGTDLTAAGGRFCGDAVKTLIETWTGTSWRVSHAPSPKQTDPAFAELVAVAVANSDSAVAVGSTDGGEGSVGFGEHWDGHRWTLD
jgi:hypothetical protein